MTLDGQPHPVLVELRRQRLTLGQPIAALRIPVDEERSHQPTRTVLRVLRPEVGVVKRQPAVGADRDAGLGPGLFDLGAWSKADVYNPALPDRGGQDRVRQVEMHARNAWCQADGVDQLQLPLERRRARRKPPGWTSEVLRHRSVSGPGKHTDLCPRSPRAGARVTPRGGGSSTGVLATPSAAWTAAGSSRGSDTGRELPAQRRGVPPSASRVTDGRLFHGVRDANGSNRRQSDAAQPIHRREQSATASPVALLLHRHVETRSPLMWWSRATSRPVGSGLARLATMTSHDQ